MATGTHAPRVRRQTATRAERHLWKHLRKLRPRGHSFKRQETFGPYVVDFACLRRRLIVEVDGSSHVSRSEYDWIRTRYLKKIGYRVLRFSNQRVLLETGAVLRSIERHLSPRPSPWKERGKN